MSCLLNRRKRQSPEDHDRRLRRHGVSIPPKPTLCDDCQSIDFYKAALLARNKTLQNNRIDGCFIASLNKELGDQRSCIMCQFFSSAKARLTVATEGFQLRAYTSFAYGDVAQTRKLPETVQSRDLPHLAVVPSTSKVPVKWSYSQAPAIYFKPQAQGLSTIFVPQTTSSRINYSNARSWVEYCKSKHKFLCSNRQEQIPDMKLLDTSSSNIRLVGSPSGAPYIALSYVWGSSKALTACEYSVLLNSKSIDPGFLPKVVLDAIEVVRNLNYRYLWVDRYCINQHNTEKKSAQIKLMDCIYRGADITIVAAAGADDTFGLPGVANTPRLPQPTIRVNDVDLISSFGHPQKAIKESMWSKRAWTFQEGLLSSRLLFFTEHEVYFECHAMQCRESMQADWDLLHCKQGKLYKSLNNGLYLGETSSTSAYIRSESKALARYYNLIQQHTMRCVNGLRYPEDILVSFAGIMNHLSKGRVPIFHLWGVPFLYSPVSPHKTLGTFVASLLWVHEYSIRATSKQPQRRLGFPSWAWSGWFGEVKVKGQAQNLYTSFKSKVLGLQVTTETDICVQFDSFIRTSSSDRPTSLFPKALNLEVMILDPASFIFRLNPQSGPSFTNGCLVSAVNPPVIDCKRVLSKCDERMGRKTGQVRKWYGLKAELHLSQGPNDSLSLRRSFASCDYALALMGVSDAPSNRSDSLPYIYFLVLQRGGINFNRVGMLAVRSAWSAFEKDFRFNNKTLSLI